MQANAWEKTLIQIHGSAHPSAMAKSYFHRIGASEQAKAASC
jgi:hypothetical protein